MSVTTTEAVLEGSTKANGREPKSCLGRIFNFKLGCLGSECNCMAYPSTPTSRVENSAQVSSCQFTFVHGTGHDSLGSGNIKYRCNPICCQVSQGTKVAVTTFADYNALEDLNVNELKFGLFHQKKI